MFERYTEKSRQVLVYAQDEARRMRHDYISAEHLLLGLLMVGDGIAYSVLGRLGVTIDPARAEVERLVGLGAEFPPGQIPFTPRAKAVLEGGLREALGLGHNYVGTEHLLISVARQGNVEGESIARVVLAKLLDKPLDDVSEAVKVAVIEALMGR